MCNLHGIVGSALTKYERSLYVELSYLSCFRGTDSSGIIGVSRARGKGYHTSYAKEAVNPVSFLSDGGFDAVWNEDPFMMIGHARAATVGKVNKANAHPFAIEHLVGAHNGTINSLFDNKRDVTDSQLLYERIARDGVDKAIESLWAGAWALTWVDTEQNKLFILRNDQRPLHYMRGAGNILVYSSEDRQLAYLKSNNQAIFKDQEITAFKPHILYSIEFGTTALEERELVRTKKDDDYYESPWYGQYFPIKEEKKPPLSVDAAQLEHYPYSLKKWEAPKPTVLLPDLSKSLLDDEVPFPASNSNDKDIYVGWNGSLSLEVAEERLNNGCSYCTKQETVNDTVVWIDPHEYLCGECVETHPELLMGSVYQIGKKQKVH